MAARSRNTIARKRRLSPLGRLWYEGVYRKEMKVPEPIITAILYFDKVPNKQVVVDEFTKHIWPLNRFSSTIENGYFAPVNGPMDTDYHFAEMEVESESDVDAYGQSIMLKPLSHTHPLWTVTLIKARQGRSGVFVRFHHSISDGLGILFAFLPMMKCQEGEVLSKIPLPAMLLGKKVASTRPQSSASRNIVHRRQSGFWLTLVGFCKAIVMFLRGALSILIMKQDSELRCCPPVKSRKPFLEFNAKRTFTRMPPVPTSLIKTVRAVHGCTFNDAILAGLSGALRRYLKGDLQDPFVGRPECKAFFLMGLPRPVDPRDASVSLANNILTPVFRMPIGELEPRGRLSKVVAMCDDFKSAAYLMGIKLTTKLLTAILPVFIMRSLASEAISKCTANITNVPLPDVPVEICGETIQEVQCLFVNAVPQISMLSYNGFVYWNIVADASLFPNARVLGQHLLDEFQALAKE